MKKKVKVVDGKAEMPGVMTISEAVEKVDRYGVPYIQFTVQDPDASPKPLEELVLEQAKEIDNLKFDALDTYQVFKAKDAKVRTRLRTLEQANEAKDRTILQLTANLDKAVTVMEDFQDRLNRYEKRLQELLVQSNVDNELLHEFAAKIKAANYDR